MIFSTFLDFMILKGHFPLFSVFVLIREKVRRCSLNVSTQYQVLVWPTYVLKPSSVFKNLKNSSSQNSLYLNGNRFVYISPPERVAQCVQSFAAQLLTRVNLCVNATKSAQIVGLMTITEIIANINNAAEFANKRVIIQDRQSVDYTL